jgi:hypothetical protein
MALNDSDAAEEVMSTLNSEIDNIVDDVRMKIGGDTHGSFRRLDQAVQQNHVDTWFTVGQQTGDLLSQRLSLVLGDCADSSGSEADSCIDDFIRRFGKLALRRPLTDEDVEFYRTFYEPSTGIDAAGVVDVVTGLLNAPEFLYLVEHGDKEADEQDNTYVLAPYELASRLSYHFWNTMPDQELLDLADSGELLEASTYEKQVERLFADERTFDTVSEFYLEWLGLEDLPELDRNNGATVYQNFAGEDLPSPELRQAMIDEAVDLLNFYTWDQPAGVEEIFLTTRSFARSDELADLYNVETWDGSSDPPELTKNRPGLLTRAAFLATGTANTRPIMKGVFIRTKMLCDKIPPPPENANATPPELSPDLTTREVVEALTEEQGTGCEKCHRSLINPLGFPTESFDSLGRARDEQQLFDEDGEPAGTKPVETDSIPQVVVGDTTPVSNAMELMERVAESGKLEACFARHYFRFTFGRMEGVETDGCALEQMRAALSETGSLADMLREVALSDTFRTRTFVPSDPASSEGN